MAAEELVAAQFSSYNLQTETPLNIEPLILMLSPLDLPLLTGVGSDGVPLLMRRPTANTVFWWQEEETPLPRATLSESGFDSSETDLTVGTGEAVKFAVGDTIRVDDEYMKVTACNTTTEVLTVTRGVLGSSAAAHNNLSEVIGVGTALPEGDLGGSTYQDRDKYSNYAQIFSRRVQATVTSTMIRKYGVPNELNHQMMKNMRALMLGVEQAALYGLKYEDSATKVRSTGGLDDFIATNVNSTDDWVTVDNIEDMQQDIWDLGGHATHLMANPKGFKAINNMEGNERISTVTVDDNRRGRRRAEVVMTEQGPIELVRNRWVRKTDAFLYIPGQFTMKQLRPLVTERLAKTDDTVTFSIVMEAGFEVKGESHMGKFTGLDIAAGLPANGV